MIKSGTRVSNKAGTGGFEFTRDVHYNEAWTYYSVLKPYGNSRMWGKKRVPNWLVDEIEKLLASSAPQPPLDYATESEHLISATFSQPPLDYAPKPIPVVYTRTINDVTYSIEDHEGGYSLHRAEVIEGCYFNYCVLRTRWLWWAKFMINVDRWF